MRNNEPRPEALKFSTAQYSGSKDRERKIIFFFSPISR